MLLHEVILHFNIQLHLPIHSFAQQKQPEYDSGCSHHFIDVEIVKMKPPLDICKYPLH